MPDINLRRFMLFNSSEGHHESREGDKLLYHWTKDQDVDLLEKINDICLCDASVNVGHRLSQKSESNSYKKQQLILYFEQTVIVILEVEPIQSIWIAVHIFCDKQDTETPLGANNVPIRAIIQIMQNIYERFCLLNGTFRMIADETNSLSKDENERATIIRNKTRTICEEYFDTFLPDIHLSSIMSNVSSLYNYILYLDLDPITLMRVNSFINHLVCINANQIVHTILIFNDQLIWSGLGMDDTRLLYGYMVSNLIRDALQEELSKEVSKVRRIKENMPIYFRSDDSAPGEMMKFYLTVFRSRNMTLGLLMSDPDLFDLIDKCEEILTSDSRLGVIPLASLAQSVGQNYLKASQGQQVVTSGGSQAQTAAAAEYICLDQLDASVSWPLNMDKEHMIQSSHTIDGVSLEGQSRKSRLIKYLIDLESELREIEAESGVQMEEFYAKTLTDSWLTATNSNYRTIYSLHQSKNSSLSEAKQNAVNLKMSLAKNRQ